MPIITEGEAAPVQQVTAIVPAAPGLRVEAYAPRDATAGIPTPSSVVAWAQLADEFSVGGVRVDPVFLANGRAWTPDQFRARYGDQVELRVVTG